MQYFSKWGMIQLKFPAHIGDRIELTHLSSATHRTLSENNYNSQLLDFDEVDMVKLSMPIFENRIIPLEVGDEYQLCFYTENGLYQCTVGFFVFQTYRAAFAFSTREANAALS